MFQKLAQKAAADLEAVDSSAGISFQPNPKMQTSAFPNPLGPLFGASPVFTSPAPGLDWLFQDRSRGADQKYRGANISLNGVAPLTPKQVQQRFIRPPAKPPALPAMQPDNITPKAENFGAASGASVGAETARAEKAGAAAALVKRAESPDNKRKRLHNEIYLQHGGSNLGNLLANVLGGGMTGAAVGGGVGGLAGGGLAAFSNPPAQNGNDMAGRAVAGGLGGGLLGMGIGGLAGASLGGLIGHLKRKSAEREAVEAAMNEGSAKTAKRALIGLKQAAGVGDTASQFAKNKADQADKARGMAAPARMTPSVTPIGLGMNKLDGRLAMGQKLLTGESPSEMGTGTRAPDKAFAARQQKPFANDLGERAAPDGPLDMSPNTIPDDPTLPPLPTTPFAASPGAMSLKGLLGTYPEETGASKGITDPTAPVNSSLSYSLPSTRQSLVGPAASRQPTPIADNDESQRFLEELRLQRPYANDLGERAAPEPGFWNRNNPLAWGAGAAGLGGAGLLAYLAHRAMSKKKEKEASASCCSGGGNMVPLRKKKLLPSRISAKAASQFLYNRHVAVTSLRELTKQADLSSIKNQLNTGSQQLASQAGMTPGAVQGGIGGALGGAGIGLLTSLMSDEEDTHPLRNMLMGGVAGGLGGGAAGHYLAPKGIIAEGDKGTTDNEPIRTT